MKFYYLNVQDTILSLKLAIPQLKYLTVKFVDFAKAIVVVDNILAQGNLLYILL